MSYLVISISFVKSSFFVGGERRVGNELGGGRRDSGGWGM